MACSHQHVSHTKDNSHLHLETIHVSNFLGLRQVPDWIKTKLVVAGLILGGKSCINSLILDSFHYLGINITIGITPACLSENLSGESVEVVVDESTEGTEEAAKKN